MAFRVSHVVSKHSSSDRYHSMRHRRPICRSFPFAPVDVGCSRKGSGQITFCSRGHTAYVNAPVLTACLRRSNPHRRISLRFRPTRFLSTVAAAISGPHPRAVAPRRHTKNALRLRHTGEGAFRRAPPCVVSRVGFYVLQTSSAWASAVRRTRPAWRFVVQRYSLNRRSRRGRSSDIGRVDLVHRREVAQIDQEDGRLHDVVERSAGRAEDLGEIAHDAMRFDGDVAVDERATRRVEGHLARDKQQVSGANGLGVGTNRRGSVLCVDGGPHQALDGPRPRSPAVETARPLL